MNVACARRVEFGIVHSYSIYLSSLVFVEKLDLVLWILLLLQESTYIWLDTMGLFVGSTSSPSAWTARGGGGYLFVPASSLQRLMVASSSPPSGRTWWASLPPMHHQIWFGWHLWMCWCSLLDVMHITLWFSLYYSIPFGCSLSSMNAYAAAFLVQANSRFSLFCIIFASCDDVPPVIYSCCTACFF